MQMQRSFRAQKRGDMVVEEIKRWIGARRLVPGDKLPKETALQELFGISKGTAREALKSLEVQGLVTVSTGPAGGATISEVPLERTFQLVQNYLFFRDLNVAQIYSIRRMLEPELAAGAVAHLTDPDLLVVDCRFAGLLDWSWQRRRPECAHSDFIGHRGRGNFRRGSQ